MVREHYRDTASSRKGYDLGNRITRDFNGNPITWIYDDLYRLTGQAKAGQVCTYTLDGVGNLKTMWEGGNFPKTFTFNAADRLVTMVEGANLTTYAYTGYGALESEITGVDTTAYTYSGQDQLIGVNPPNGRLSTYSFDGDGLRRTIQEGNVQATSVVWDGSDYLCLKRPGISPSQMVLTLDSEIVHAGGKDLLTDPLGSLVKEISAGASLGSLIEMYPYGSLVAGTGSATTPYVYIAAYGYFRDTAERDYVRARELLKKLGRWMQVDPRWPAESSLGYASSNPVSLIDQNGEFPNGMIIGIIRVLNCLDKLNKAKETACRIVGQNRDCIIGCYKKCWFGHGWPVSEFERRYSCLSDWCKKGAQLEVIPPWCKGCDPGDLGATPPAGGSDCKAGICLEACESGWGSLIGLPIVIIHEVAHCCEHLSEKTKNTEKETRCLHECITEKCTKGR